MYSILIKDYENKQSRFTNPVAHYSTAMDACEDLAFKFIWNREGERYFKSFPPSAFPSKQKNAIKKGYALIRKEDSIGLKLTVYYKEPNGFILSGELKKIIQFQTIQTGAKMPEDGVARESEMEEFWLNLFDRVVEILNKAVPETEN